jgi:hypothetical protein
MRDITTLNLSLHLFREPGSESLGLSLPIQRPSVLRECAIAKADFDGVLFGRVSVWKYSFGRSLVVEWTTMFTDIRVKKKYVAALVRTEFGDSGNSLLVLPLPLLQ